MALMNWREMHGDAFEGGQALVTGGAGFIGSHLSEALLDLGTTVVVLDDLTGGDVANFETYRDRAGDRLRFIEGSILDGSVVAEAVAGCRWVFHQAAWGSVPRSVAMPDRYHAINATGTMNILEAARAAGVARVMFAASSSAYGDTPTLPKVETMPVRARSPYAANKSYGEALMRAWANSYGGSGLDTASLRYFNIFGPRQNANSAYAAVIAAFAKALLAGERPVIYGDGEQSRDFTFVDNAVHANLLAARHDAPLLGEVFNVACGQRVTVNELAAAMARQLGRPELTPVHKDDRPGDVKHSLADLSLIKQTLGYKPVVEFEQGLAVTVDWYRQIAAGV
jgi:UDP-glucose 4-epimerase